MKKIILFLAAIITLVLLNSCNKTTQPAATVNIPAAEYTDQAKKLVIMDSDQNPGLKSVEFTESGRYIICQQVFKTGPLAVKADNVHVQYIHGTYTVNNNIYTLDGFGTITVTGNQINIQTTEDTIVVNYTEAEKYPANDFYTTIARAWKVDKTDVSVRFDDGKAVGVVKDGCDIPSLLKELEEKANVNLRHEEFEGYVVSEINVTLSKTIAVVFTGRTPIAGPITLSGDGALSYTLDGSSGVAIFSGKADGQVNLSPGLGSNQIMLTLNTEVTSKSGKTYTGKVSLVLSPKN